MSKSEIDPLAKTLRSTARTLLSPALRSEHRPNSHSLARAEILLEQGYGLIVAFNHFSKRDPFQVLKEMFSNKTILGKQIVSPIALHQSNESLIKIAASHGIRMHDIVTQDTLDTGKNRGLEKGEGLIEFTQDALDCLASGGIVMIPPQEGRRVALGPPERRTINTLLAQAKRRKIENIAVMTLGLGFANSSDYSKRGFNSFRQYTVGIGHTFKMEELLAAAGGSGKVDDFLYQELAINVPSDYLSPKLKVRDDPRAGGQRASQEADSSKTF